MAGRLHREERSRSAGGSPHAACTSLSAARLDRPTTTSERASEEEEEEEEEERGWRRERERCFFFELFQLLLFLVGTPTL
jgi:ribosomal protein L12E/L44/L45/RPP1/RPP2